MAEIVAVSPFSIILVLVPVSIASVFVFVFLHLRFYMINTFFVLGEQKAFHSLFYVSIVVTNITNTFFKNQTIISSYDSKQSFL